MESQKKLFTEKQISVSAFLGGPIPPGLLIYQNFIRLKKEKEAYIVLAATLIFTVGLIFALVAIPDNVFTKIPSQLFPTLVGLSFWGLYRILLTHFVKEELETGSPIESNWKVAGVTIVGIVVYLGIALGIGFLQPPFPGEKISFSGNEIYFDENTSGDDVKKLSDQLFNIEYFSEENPNVARLETWKTRYVVTLPIVVDYWNDEAIIAELTSLKWLLEIDFGKKVTLMLEDYKLNGDRVTKSL